VVAVNAGTQDAPPPHSADPSALEDPVHQDVAVHELHEEPASDQPGSEAETDDPPEYGPEADPVEPTGEARVDAAVERLRELARRPPAEHVAIYEDVHRRLQDALADLDGS
jgi:hypothetical protein